MESIELKAALRKETGKKASKTARAEELVPCVLYGGKENISFSAPEKSFRDIIYTPTVYVVKLDIEGQSHQALIKETQFHPVSDRLLHVDFYEIADDKQVTVNIPVKLTGSSVGVREGGKLQLENRKLAVKGFTKDIPAEIEVDITNLGIGKSVRAGEVQSDKFTVVTPKELRIATVRSTRAAAAAEAAPAAAAK